MSYPDSTSSLFGRNIRHLTTDFGPTTGSQTQQSINVSVFCLYAFEAHQICGLTVSKKKLRILDESVHKILDLSKGHWPWLKSRWKEDKNHITRKLC